MALGTSFARVSIASGLFSTGFTLVVVASVWAGVVHFFHFDQTFHAEAVSAHLMFRPEWFVTIVRLGGLTATVVTVGMVMAHAFILAFAAGVATFFAIRIYKSIASGTLTLSPKPPFLRIGASPRSERRINAGYTPAGRDLVRVYNDRIKITLETPGGSIYHNVFPEFFLRLRRVPIKLKREPKTPVERLEVALTEMLVAHREWPADPDGHHSDTSLLEHTMSVTQRLVDHLPEEPLARVIGLSHDIGKLLAYAAPTGGRGDGATWQKRTKEVDRLSAQVMRLTPEFWQLEAKDRHTINVLLTYTHSPDRMPRGSTTQRERDLLQAVRICDGVSTHHEQASASDHADDVDIITTMRERVVDVIAGLNINQVRDPDAHADGWVQPANGIALIQTKRLREGFFGVLDPVSARKLALRSSDNSPGRVHPATVALHTALGKEGLLIEDWRGFRPDMAQFEAKVGRVTFAGLFLIDLAELRKRMPDTVKEWGKSAYPIRIKKDSAKRDISRG